MQIKKDIEPTSKEIYADPKLRNYYGIPRIGERIIEYGCIKCGSPDIEILTESHLICAGGGHACEPADWEEHFIGYKCNACGALSKEKRLIRVVSERYFPEQFNEKSSKQILAEAKKNMPVLGDVLITIHNGAIFVGAVIGFNPEEDFGDYRRRPIIAPDNYKTIDGKAIDSHIKISASNFIKDNDGKIWKSIITKSNEHLFPINENIQCLEAVLSATRKQQSEVWKQIVPEQLQIRSKEEENE